MKKAVFLHIFKTGGTSLQHWFAEHYKSRFVPTNAGSFHRQVRSDECGIRGHDLIAGHMSAEDALRFSDSHTILTVLREPEAQLMSALWHLYTHAEGTTKRQPQRFDHDSLPALIEIAEQIAVTGDGMQSLFLAPGRIDMNDPRQRRRKIKAAAATLRKVDVVGITERLPETLRLFANRLQVDPPQQQPHARNAGAGRHGLTPELREILRHPLEIDQHLYKAAVRRFRYANAWVALQQAFQTFKASPKQPHAPVGR